MRLFTFIRPTTVALKPSIYKFRINLSDLNRDYYDTLNLTLAQHPSETLERMMVRVLAYCLNAQEYLTFTKGLSDTDEPDLWVKSMDDTIPLWIDVGEPAYDRVKKVCRLAEQVIVYCFNSKADMWWSKEESKIAQTAAKVMQFPWPAVHALAQMVERTMDISVTITDDSAYVATAQGEVEVSWKQLQNK
jgi:uncharacterized protein YaeQ